MNAQPEADAVRRFLTRAGRRALGTRVGIGAAAGLAAALPVSLVLAWVMLQRSSELSLTLTAALALGGLAAGVWIALRERLPAARAVELRAPACRNLLITAAELLERPDRVRPWLAARISAEASRLVSTLDPAVLFPAGRTLLTLAAAAILWTVLLVLIAARPQIAKPSLTPATGIAPAIRDVVVSLEPPAYTALPSETLQNPARIEAIAGSRLRLTVRASAAAVSLQTLDGRQPLTTSGDGTFTGESVAETDGYLALEPSNTDGRPGARRLMGLTLRPDSPPVVRITAPGRDLLLPDAQRTIPVTVEAHDDFALGSLTLRYTRVSGSGEQFTFTDGEIALDIALTDERTWSGGGTLRLDTMGLGPGDMIVYRGVAGDRRPGAAAVESDAFIVEIRAPGDVAAGGFAIDDEEDRYAISQQMVILKTERLLARAATVPADSLATESQNLAAEQRSVRAEFVFMMGGELAEEILAAASMADLNEEAHAEADDEVIAGRLANQGRDALLAAIRAMSRANTALIAADLRAALAAERTALANLERAFSRTRYILRALTERERLDLTRRLTGLLAGAGRDVRPQAASQTEPRVAALRRALANLAAQAGSAELGTTEAAALLRIADDVLRADPGSPALRDVTTRVNEAANAIGAGRTVEARRELDQAATLLTAALRARFVASPGRAVSPATRRLGGALTDALRQPTRLP